MSGMSYRNMMNSLIAESTHICSLTYPACILFSTSPQLHARPFLVYAKPSVLIFYLLHFLFYFVTCFYSN